MIQKMRRSEQREMIRAEVYARCDHPTAEAVYSALRAKAPNLSLGTVYRNLNLLAEQGVIRRLPIPGQPDHYDFNTTAHCHFCCRVCHAVSDLAFGESLNLMPALPVDGYHVESYNLVYSGVCPACSEKSNVCFMPGNS